VSIASPSGESLHHGRSGFTTKNGAPAGPLPETSFRETVGFVRRAASEAMHVSSELTSQRPHGTPSHTLHQFNVLPCTSIRVVANVFPDCVRTAADDGPPEAQRLFVLRNDVMHRGHMRLDVAECRDIARAVRAFVVHASSSAERLSKQP